MPRWNLLYSDAANIFWVHNGNVARRVDRTMRRLYQFAA
jgi:hypothetical protein